MSQPPHYEIEVDPRTCFMRLTFAGMMDHAIIDRFEQEMAAAIARRPVRDGRAAEWLFLCDLRAAGIQSRDISARLQSIMADHAPVMRRTAMIMSGSSLELLQARRVTASNRTDFFMSEDAARAWLLDDSIDAAAA